MHFVGRYAFESNVVVDIGGFQKQHMLIVMKFDIIKPFNETIATLRKKTSNVLSFPFVSEVIPRIALSKNFMLSEYFGKVADQMPRLGSAGGVS